MLTAPSITSKGFFPLSIDFHRLNQFRLNQNRLDVLFKEIICESALWRHKSWNLEMPFIEFNHFLVMFHVAKFEWIFVVEKAIS